jgi:hypothetical protein
MTTGETQDGSYYRYWLRRLAEHGPMLITGRPTVDREIHTSTAAVFERLGYAVRSTSRVPAGPDDPRHMYALALTDAGRRRLTELTKDAS